MDLSITTSFAFELGDTADALLQFETAAVSGQHIVDASTRLIQADTCSRIAAHDGVGERIWVRAQGRLDIEYRARVAIDRTAPDIATLAPLPLTRVPAEAAQYLFDSRYCPTSQFQPFVESEFAGTTGGERIEAIRAWIHDNFTYAPGSSDVRTDARDSFIERRGICRDYAHVLVTMARASGIPARYVASYGPDVDPPDFHALAQVYLEDPARPGRGAWQLVDATAMADPASTAIIGVGRDAADVSFLTSFGPCNFLMSRVSAKRETHASANQVPVHE